MALDPNIILQGQQADPLGAYGKALTLKGLMAQQEMQGMQLDQARQQAQQERTLADLYRGNVGADGQVNRQAVLSSMADRGLGARIPQLQKQWAEADSEVAKLGEVKAKTTKLGVEAEAGKAKYVGDLMGRLASNPNITHDDVIRELSQVPPEYADGAARLVRSMPGDPGRLRQYLMTVGMEADKRLAAVTPQFQKIDAGNRVITGTTDPMTGAFTPSAGAPITKAPEGFIVGPNGRLQADPGWMEAKLAQARAGKTDINLAVNTEKSLTAEMAKGLAGQLDESLAGAKSSVGQIENARNLRRLLDSGNVITGPGANARIMMTQIGSALGITGKDAEEQLANTRAAIQNLAQAELTAAAGMKGQGAITDAERAMLKKAAAGDIDMTSAELKALASAVERNAQIRIQMHQGQVERLKSVPGAEPMIPFYSVQSPGGSAAPPAPAASADAMVRATLKTESNGRRYGPDGTLLTSPKGAQGEMQVMPGTNRDPGYGVTPARDNSPEELARVGRDYLGAMMRKYGNDPAKAWAAYNAGPGALDAAMKAGGAEWLAKMPAETQAYVRKNMQQLQGSGAQAAPAPAATPRPAAPAQPPARVAAAPAGQRQAAPQRAPTVSNW